MEGLSRGLCCRKPVSPMEPTLEIEPASDEEQDRSEPKLTFRAQARSPRGLLARIRRQRRAHGSPLSLRPMGLPEEVDVEPVRWRVDRRFSHRFLDQDAVKVIRRLNFHGYPAYLVGGCVRDLYLGRLPKDFDIATAATPRQVKRLFRNSRIIGRRFRLVHVTFGAKSLDVSTFRTLAEPTSDDPMIRQDNVFGTASEDARRRDFTINGLFFDVDKGEVLDYVGGLNDLERGVIETIGDPWTRFREDPVRMLRAIKFAGRLGLRLADDVFQAIVDCAPDIQKAAAPRIFEEINRLLERGGAEQSVRLLWKTGLFHLLLPEAASVLEKALSQGRLPPLWQCYGRLDALARGGIVVPIHTLLALLFLEIFDEYLYAPSGGQHRSDLPIFIENELRPIGQRLRMSRRDLYMVKQVLLAQRSFTGATKSKRRKGSTKGLSLKDHFGSAWLLFKTQSEVTGRYQAQRHEWEDRLSSHSHGG